MIGPYFKSKSGKRKHWKNIKTPFDVYDFFDICVSQNGYSNFIHKLIREFNDLFTRKPLFNNEFTEDKKLYLPIVKLKKNVKTYDKVLANIVVNKTNHYILVAPNKDEIPEINGLFNFDNKADIGFASYHVAQFACI